MDRYAIFVDAGYFFAAGAQAAFGNHTPRKQVSVKSPQAMLDALCSHASAAAGHLPLLRAYWYDAMPGPRLSMEQTSLAMLTGIKLRLGALNSAGEQKGVDSLIVTDMIDLARNRAIADAVVITGDEDLRIAVQVAQSFGVRVHILAAGDPTKNVSPALQMEADSVTTLDSNWFAGHLELKTAMIAPPPVIPEKLTDPLSVGPAASDQTKTAPEVTIETAAEEVINGLVAAISEDKLIALVQHFQTQHAVPPEYDRPLIARVSAAMNSRRFSGDEARHIRSLFIRAVKAKA